MLYEDTPRGKLLRAVVIFAPCLILGAALGSPA